MPLPSFTSQPQSTNQQTNKPTNPPTTQPQNQPTQVDYSDDAAFSAVDAATAPKKSRAASSGYKELDGKAPYRPDFVKGVQADVLPGVAPAPKRSAKVQ